MTGKGGKRGGGDSKRGAKAAKTQLLRTPDGMKKKGKSKKTMTGYEKAKKVKSKNQ